MGAFLTFLMLISLVFSIFFLIKEYILSFKHGRPHLEGGRRYKAMMFIPLGVATLMNLIKLYVHNPTFTILVNVIGTILLGVSAYRFLQMRLREKGETARKMQRTYKLMGISFVLTMLLYTWLLGAAMFIK